MSEHSGYGHNHGNVSKPVFCKKGCGQKLIFDANVKSPSGKLVPLNLNRTKHECTADPFFQRVAKQQPYESQQETDDDLIKSAQNFTEYVNSRLRESEIVVTVRRKSGEEESR